MPLLTVRSGLGTKCSGTRMAGWTLCTGGCRAGVRAPQGTGRRTPRRLVGPRSRLQASKRAISTLSCAGAGQSLALNPQALPRLRAAPRRRLLSSRSAASCWKPPRLAHASGRVPVRPLTDRSLRGPGVAGTVSGRDRQRLKSRPCERTGLVQAQPRDWAGQSVEGAGWRAA